MSISSCERGKHLAAHTTCEDVVTWVVGGQRFSLRVVGHVRIAREDVRELDPAHAAMHTATETAPVAHLLPAFQRPIQLNREAKASRSAVGAIRW